MRLRISAPMLLEQIRLLTNLKPTLTSCYRSFWWDNRSCATSLIPESCGRSHNGSPHAITCCPLSRRETSNYVAHRLAVAGIERALFTSGALKRVHELSGGIPRIINILCDRALLGAYATRRQVVNRRIVNKAAAELREKRLDQF